MKNDDVVMTIVAALRTISGADRARPAAEELLAREPTQTKSLAATYGDTPTILAKKVKKLMSATKIAWSLKFHETIGKKGHDQVQGGKPSGKPAVTGGRKEAAPSVDEIQLDESDWTVAITSRPSSIAPSISLVPASDLPCYQHKHFEHAAAVVAVDTKSIDHVALGLNIQDLHVPLLFNGHRRGYRSGVIVQLGPQQQTVVLADGAVQVDISQVAAMSQTLQLTVYEDMLRGDDAAAPGPGLPAVFAHQFEAGAQPAKGAEPTGARGESANKTADRNKKAAERRRKFMRLDDELKAMVQSYLTQLIPEIELESPVHHVHRQGHKPGGEPSGRAWPCHPRRLPRWCRTGGATASPSCRASGATGRPWCETARTTRSCGCPSRAGPALTCAWPGRPFMRCRGSRAWC